MLRRLQLGCALVLLLTTLPPAMLLAADDAKSSPTTRVMAFLREGDGEGLRAYLDGLPADDPKRTQAIRLLSGIVSARTASLRLEDVPAMEREAAVFATVFPGSIETRTLDEYVRQLKPRYLENVLVGKLDAAGAAPPIDLLIEALEIDLAGEAHRRLAAAPAGHFSAADLQKFHAAAARVAPLQLAAWRAEGGVKYAYPGGFDYRLQLAGTAPPTGLLVVVARAQAGAAAAMPPGTFWCELPLAAGPRSLAQNAADARRRTPHPAPRTLFLLPHDLPPAKITPESGAQWLITPGDPATLLRWQDDQWTPAKTGTMESLFAEATDQIQKNQR